MLIFTLEALVVWSVIATVTGFAMGAVIQKGERLGKDKYLDLLFATIANQQASR